jgi:hypothetical protein
MRVGGSGYYTLCFGTGYTQKKDYISIVSMESIWYRTPPLGLAVAKIKQ